MSANSHQISRYQRRSYPELAVKIMEDIIATPSGPERWGKTIKAWRKFGPAVETPDGFISAAEYDVMQIEYNLSTREGLKDEFGSIGSGSDAGFMREALAIPADLWAWIKAFDRPAFTSLNDNKDMLKRNLQAFMKAFPEYSIPEKT